MSSVPRHCSHSATRSSSQRLCTRSLGAPLQPQRHPQQQPVPLHSFFAWSTGKCTTAWEVETSHSALPSTRWCGRPCTCTLVCCRQAATSLTERSPRLTEKVQPHICDLHEAHFRMTKPPTKTKTPASDARAKADSPDSSHRAYRSSPDAQSRRTSVYSDESSTSVLPQRSPAPSPRRKLPHQKTSHRTKTRRTCHANQERPMTKHITAQLGDSMCLTAVPTPWAHVGSSKSSRQKGADKAPARPNHVRKES